MQSLDWKLRKKLFEFLGEDFKFIPFLLSKFEFSFKEFIHGSFLTPIEAMNADLG